MKRMIFPAKLKSLGEIIDFALREARSGDLKKYDLNKIRVLCEEVALNIIKYAYPNRDGNIEITCSTGNRYVQLEFIDEGTPFNPLDYPISDANLNVKNNIHGKMGIRLFRGIADKTNYKRDNNRNVLEILIGKKEG